ncbi:MAG: hypothetical protein ACI9SF_000286 [Candidatus Nanohaloarchaea archaeon]|jgi:hypothetical protein
MRPEIVFFTSLVLLTGSVSAFNAGLEVVDRTATIEDPAVFNLTVENNYIQEDRFRISSIQSPPVASNWFNYEYSKTIDSQDQKSFIVKVTPEENAIQQNYAFTLNLRSFRKDESRKVDSFFTVVNEYDLRLTSFQVSGQELEPGNAVNISATIQNTASNTLDNFTVEVEGFGDRVEKKGAVLGSGDSIRYNFKLDVPDMHPPGDERISIRIKNDGREAQSASQEVEIGEVNEIRKNTSENDKLLVKTETVSLRNTGNVDSEENVTRSLPVYLDPLTDFEPVPDETETSGADQRYVWNVGLEPGQSKQISYTVSYIPALGFVGLLFLGVLGFRKLQTDIKVSKTATYQDSRAKIRIELENNSSTSLEDLKVTDFVPDIAEVSQEFEMARPVVTKTSNGTRLEWEIGDLAPGEQRVLVYTIKPLVEVEGGVNLDSAEVLRNDEKIKETSEINVEFQPE